MLYIWRVDSWWVWPKTSWQHGQLFTMLASTSSRCHPAIGVLTTNILLSHAICPSVCRSGFMTRKIASEIDPVLITSSFVQCHNVPWTGLLSWNFKLILRPFFWFSTKVSTPENYLPCGRCVHTFIIFNPQCMREGSLEPRLTFGFEASARVTVAVLCVCLSVTTLAATYLICESKLRCCKVPYGVPNTWFVWISQKTLCSPVLASFADSKVLDFSQLAVAWLYV